jgi:ClpX C4-type zinc finger
VQDPSHYSDVVCSFCGRHNREVRVVANDAGLIVCQVCVAKCAEIFDHEVGLDPQHPPWSERWPLKTRSGDGDADA